MAEKIILHFNQYGEDQFLVDAGEQVNELMPNLFKLALAGTNAKDDLEAQWEREYLENIEDEDD